MTSPAITAEPDRYRHIVSPAKKITTAVIILLTGSCVAAVFWQMPQKQRSIYEICDQTVVDQQLVAAPLPKETISHATLGEIEQMSLPMLEESRSTDAGNGKYAQAYPTPEVVAAIEREKLPTKDDEQESFAVIAHKIEPVRQLIPSAAIQPEAVDKTFQEIPKNDFDVPAINDEMTTRFQFAENINAENADKKKLMPQNPFPKANSNLKPLEPLLPQSHLSPLKPL